MSQLRNNSGFTLVELMIATAILATGALGIAALTIGIIRGNAFSNKITTATALAQDKLEDIQGLGYANAPSAAGTEAYGSIANFPSYKRVTSVTPDTPGAGMRTATVTVYWESEGRRGDTAYNVAVSTILTSP